jgi:hypothetical protein
MTGAHELRSLAGRAASALFRCGLVLDSFDTDSIDGVGVNAVARLMRATSAISLGCEVSIVETPVKLGAGAIWALSFPVRMIQSGRIQGYMLSIVIGLIAILGYCLHLARHAIR